MAEGAIDPGRPTAEAALSAFLHGRSDGDPGVKVVFDGGHRTVPPATTLERLLPLTAELGITRCANLTHLDRIGVPVASAVRPLARSGTVSLGKGASPEAAKAAALLAAAEAHHAERIRKPLRFASGSELQDEAGLADLAGLPMQAGAAYAPGDKRLWLEGRDLLADLPLWLPFEAVSADLTLPRPPGSGVFRPSRDGLAAGNHLLEALCAGLCEVVERDAALRWAGRAAAQRARSRLDLGSVAVEPCRAILDSILAAGLQVAAWEITSELGIAAFRCRIDEGGEAAEPARPPGVGTACHPDRGAALAAALLEAAAGRLAVLAGLRAAPEPDAGDDGEDDYKRRFAEAPDARHETFAQDVGHVLDRLQASGLRQVALVDLSAPGAPYAVVRVVVPGLALEGEAQRPIAGAAAPVAQPKPPGRRVVFRKPSVDSGVGS